MKFDARPLVYVAGPYTRPDPVENVHKTVIEADALARSFNVTPVVPHLTATWHMICPHDLEWWYEYDLAILARCDALYRMPGESTGADAEVEYAKARGIPVLYNTKDLLVWLRKRGQA